MAKLIIANWKMNPQTVAEAMQLAKASDADGLVVCPPFPFLEAVGKVLKQAQLGAQDLPPERREGVRYAILGHSSRRKLGETDEMVAQKVAAAVQRGIAPIVCIGETRADRTAGKSQEVIERQFKAALSKPINSSTHQLINLIVAYEPVWAISIEPDAQPDTPENAVAMIQFMKSTVPSSQFPVPRFIYGGSVTAANAESFLKQKEIEGALVGGASLQPDKMRKILEVASQY